MSRLTILVIVVSLIFGFSTQDRNFAESQVSSMSSDRLDGVYEFVSESAVLVEPKKATHQRKSPEWVGIWQFQKGYFTRILMKRRRDTFFDPKKREDFVFESSGGRYETEGSNVRLVQDQAFHPFDVDRTVLLDYRFDGDTLVFTQALQPYIEDLRKGTITTVLRRLK